uniref:Uncharacterized protein n=1 Tax=Arundo donax TaxID=35708 RepID=A0A0A9BNA4_ARUDO
MAAQATQHRRQLARASFH